MEDLYSELKPDIVALSDPLFQASETFVRNRGGFVPHGAVLASDGNVRLMMAGPERDADLLTPAEVLPFLHEALRDDARQDEVLAVAVCEDVSITLPGQAQTKAIKVLIEHRRGLTVSLYLPWKRKLLRGHAFGEVMALPAEPEVRPWDDGAPA